MGETDDGIIICWVNISFKSIQAKNIFFFVNVFIN